MVTITQAARQVDLSRSTLLYYDRIGLLRPTGRTSGGYRLYSPADLERLRKIAFYRRTGASLDEIGRMLEASASALRVLLEKRLGDLNRQVQTLRGQQEVIVRLLKHDRLPAQLRGMDKHKWVALLAAVGLDEEGMLRWHVEFEQLSPQGHHDFLAALGIVETEILAIRRWSQDAGGSRASVRVPSTDASGLNPPA